MANDKPPDFKANAEEAIKRRMKAKGESRAEASAQIAGRQDRDIKELQQMAERIKEEAGGNLTDIEKGRIESCSYQIDVMMQWIVAIKEAGKQ